MGKINVKFPVLEEYTKSINAIIQDINDSDLNNKEKRDTIKVLRILLVKKQTQAELINKNFKRPVDTDDIHTKDESLPNMTGVKPKEFKGDERVVPPKK